MRSTPAPRQPIFQLQQPGTGWMAWLNIVWSIWIFLVPLMNPGAFPGWLLPTLASYALFLLMFQRVHYGDRRWIPWLALGMGALGFVLTPLNPGAQGYVIYACAYLPFCLAPRRAIPAMVLVLAL